MKKVFYYETAIGELGIAENGSAITDLCLPGERVIDEAEAVIEETRLIKKAASQLIGYFSGRLKDFNLPLEPDGTDFMQSVWKALQTIPYGETRSYKEIAQSIGRPNAYRAVGLANNRNPIAIVIPCHRVIGADGSLVGYGGGLDVKEKLLTLEKRYS